MVIAIGQPKKYGNTSINVFRHNMQPKFFKENLSFRVMFQQELKFKNIYLIPSQSHALLENGDSSATFSQEKLTNFLNMKLCSSTQIKMVFDFRVSKKVGDSVQSFFEFQFSLFTMDVGKSVSSYYCPVWLLQSAQCSRNLNIQWLKFIVHKEG